jgi:tRNA(adenine34) deaminase
MLDHEYFMKRALQQAQLASEDGEIPVGAVVVSEGQIIAKAHNQTERLNDITAHAEMLAITAAANNIGGKYLTNCTLYVTLEPCVMCAGALYWSQIGTLVFGASDLKRGFMRLSSQLLHPKTEVLHGVLAEESKQLLKQFFLAKRRK